MKKKLFLEILVIFPLLETIEKKKKLVQEFGNLLLHDLYCETVLWGTVAKTRRWARHQARTGALG